jgi:beta-lactamase class A
VDVDARLEVRESDKRGGSGILKVLEPGLRPTIRDLATLMTVLSDNTATNLAIDAVGGVAAVNAAMDQLGLDSIRLHNPIDVELSGADVRRLGETTPRQMCDPVHGIASRNVFGLDVSEAVERILAGQQYLNQVPRYMQVSPFAADLGLVPRVTVANKTGFSTGTRADTGIVRYRDGGGFSYAVFNHGSKDQTFLPEAEGDLLAGLVGKTLLEHWWPADRDTPPVVSTAYDQASPHGEPRERRHGRRVCPGRARTSRHGEDVGVISAG